MQVHWGSRAAEADEAEAARWPWLPAAEAPVPWWWAPEPCDGEAGVELVRRLADTLRWLFARPDSRRSEYDEDALRENLNAGLCEWQF